MSETLARIERWYAGQCDGSWEHQYGVRLETIDNPGWRMEIDLKGTPLLQKAYEGMALERTETDWLQCRIREGKFEGFGGPGNLEELLLVFLSWAEESQL